MNNLGEQEVRNGLVISWVPLPPPSPYTIPLKVIQGSGSNFKLHDMGVSQN